MLTKPKLSQVRSAVLISGRGSNLQALLDKEGCNIRLVCSHKKSAPGILKAKRCGIPTKIFSPLRFAELEAFLKEKYIEKIFLLGFMKILPEGFVHQWQGQIVNLHPSLLPLYPGTHSIERSFEDKNKLGVSLHTVIPAMDEGPIIQQSCVAGKDSSFYPQTLEQAAQQIAMREHFLVRKYEDHWL
ncbi:MAG: phosphoribosylglycinamide formyltransferase [Bdellovibrionaceae bacterium]|nr:phosphoribosylglycinamide formyltransferase [Pseudobdellovibrionaceae bacterium]